MVKLEYLVDVLETTGGGGQYWETIAAFNVEVAAENYANECREANPGRDYRVRDFTLYDLDRLEEFWNR